MVEKNNRFVPKKIIKLPYLVLHKASSAEFRTHEALC